MGNNIQYPLPGRKESHDIRHQCMAVGIAQHNVGVGKGFGSFRERLRHTAGENNHGVGIFSAGTMEGLANLVVAGRCYGTGVDEDNVAFFSFGRDRKTCGRKLRQHGLRFILIDLAAKCDC